jgi:hypothetical protein
MRRDAVTAALFDVPAVQRSFPHQSEFQAGCTSNFFLEARRFGGRKGFRLTGHNLGSNSDCDPLRIIHRRRREPSSRYRVIKTATNSRTADRQKTINDGSTALRKPVRRSGIKVHKDPRHLPKRRKCLRPVY